jgi:hypothetical protein
MGDTNSQSVVDAVHNVTVLAFDLAGSQIADMPDELAAALQKPDVQSAIQTVLSTFVLSRQQTGTTQVSDKEAKQLVADLWKKAGGKLTDGVLEQLKKTPEYRKLDASINDLEKTVKTSPLGIWVDKNKGILYVIGAGLAVGGAVALYVTKTGGTVVNTSLAQLAGKPIQIFKVGRFSLSGQMLAFRPDMREIGGGLVGAQQWKKVQVSVQFGVIATGSDVKQIDGKVVVKTQDIDIGLTATDDRSKNTYNFGLTFGLHRVGGEGPLSLGVTAMVKDDKVVGGGITGNWQLDNTTAVSLQGSSGAGEAKGLVLLTKRF